MSTYQTSTAKKGALVDRGGNGGLAGSDVRSLYKTEWQVDVQGIDNHQLTNIQIVTAAGVVESQHGHIVQWKVFYFPFSIVMGRLVKNEKFSLIWDMFDNLN